MNNSPKVVMQLLTEQDLNLVLCVYMCSFFHVFLGLRFIVTIVLFAACNLRLFRASININPRPVDCKSNALPIATLLHLILRYNRPAQSPKTLKTNNITTRFVL